MPRKTRNLLDPKLKNALAKCCGELKSLAPQLTSGELEEKLSKIFDVRLQIIFGSQAAPATFGACIVLDNASYHNVRDIKHPTSASRKTDMIALLRQNKIPHNPQDIESELYNFVKLYKTKTPDYRFDKILKGHGHDILRLPPTVRNSIPVKIFGVS